MSRILLILYLYFSVLMIIPHVALADSQYEASSSYELFYPVVAGKLPGDILYPLKILREQFVGLLIFDSYRKVDYYLVLSKKRLVEAEAMVAKKKDQKEISKSTLDAASFFQKSLELTNSLNKQGKKVTDLYSTLSSDGEKELQFLKSLSSKVDINPAISKFQKLLQEVNQNTSK